MTIKLSEVELAVALRTRKRLEALQLEAARLNGKLLAIVELTLEAAVGGPVKNEEVTVDWDAGEIRVAEQAPSPKLVQE